MVERIFVWSLMVLIALAPVTAQQKKKNPLGQIFGQTNALSEDKIILGLKEALNIGTGNAVTVTRPIES